MAVKVFIDTNVFLDAYLQRTIEWTEANAILELAADASIKASTSASCLLNAIYSLKAQAKLTSSNIIAIIELTLSYINLLNPSGPTFLQSLQSGFSDLEDAVQYYTALSGGDMDFFITSNIKDFKKASSQLPVVTPK